MAVTAGLALSLAACAGLPQGQYPVPLGPAERQQLNSSLNVASASAEAGQIEAAERLYAELSRHFPNQPEPRLGLAYLALRADDFPRAGKFFIEADRRSTTPAARAEALLGAGRANLGAGDVAAAKTHFLAAAELAQGTAAEAWVANGLGVAATIEGDHARARKHFEDAVRLSPSHPMITANLVRALAQSGAEDEARQLYAKFPASHWLDEDGETLARLLDDKKVAEAAPAPEAETPAPATGAQVQLFSSRTRAGALAAWGRLAAAEKELLGSLAHRVMKAEVRGRGVFYGLRAGPLADTRAARRLCARLKSRGRDCYVPAGRWTGGGPGKSPDTRPDRAREPAKEPSPAPSEAGGATVQLFSSRTRAGALAAWGRLAAAEKDLLGSLTHRVVKAVIPKKGTYYRLFAGPLDRGAAVRLCGRLKGRGRDCLVRAGK